MELRKYLNKTISKIRFKLYYVNNYIYSKSPIYINLNCYKCIRLWLKCCLIFRSPVIIYHKLIKNDFLYDYFYLENPTNKLLYINCSELGYKYKFGDLRFESVPYIIVEYNGIRHVWGFEAPLFTQYLKTTSDGKTFLNYYRDNSTYWEAILDYLYISKKNIYKVFNNHISSRWIGCDDTSKPNQRIYYTILECLRSGSQKKIANKLNEIP